MVYIYYLLIFFILLSEVSANNFSELKDYKKTKVSLKIKELSKKKLNHPWGMTFIDDKTLLITEKNGRIIKIDTVSDTLTEIKHEIPNIEFNGTGQGGLLDVYAHSDGYIYFTYSHDFKDSFMGNKKNKSTSTAIAKGKLFKDEIIGLEILLIAKPRLKKNKHWGARIVIKNDILYAGLGERDEGMIAQDPQKHPGSIIRIKTDGSIPKDNPAFNGYEEWLPEIYQIGLRNPQGITISPHDDEIYFSQHGPMGGDNIGKVKFSGNFGWKDIAWGGKEYTGRSIGDSAFKDQYDEHLITWVPSIAVGNIAFYKGKTFKEWEGDLLICATKEKLLARLDFENNKIVNKEIIIKDEGSIGRIRDFEFDSEGNIYVISDAKESSLWLINRN